MVNLNSSFPLVSLAEAARRLGIDPSTLRRWIQQGKLQAVRIGRNYKLSLQELERHPHITALITTQPKEEISLAGSAPLSAAKVAKEVVMYSGDLYFQFERWQQAMVSGIPKQLSPRTIHGYTVQFKRYIKELSAVLPKQSIEISDVLNHANVADALGRIPPEQYSTRYQVYRAIVAFCNFLVDREVVDGKVREKLKRVIPKRKGDPKRTFLKDEAEILRFFDAIWLAPGNTLYDKKLTEAVCKTMFLTGIRREELCSLRLDDVDLERGVILVRNGKGGKSRQLGINPSLRLTLKKYLTARPKTMSDRFFVNRDGEAIPPDNLSKRVHRIAKRTGLDVNCHSFRRTYATRRALGGEPIPLIQGALGHADETMTNKYIRLQAHNIVEAMQQYKEIDPTRPQWEEKPKTRAVQHHSKPQKKAIPEMIQVRVVSTPPRSRK